MTVRNMLIVLAVAALAGCSALPRGAALEREILNVAKDDDGQALPQFQVAPVTRETLDSYSKWPSVTERTLPWIRHQEQPAGRMISPGDSVVMTIWDTERDGLFTFPGSPNSTMPPMEVAANGRIFLPYLGAQKVSGLSPSRAREIIQERYNDVVPGAQVQLAHQPGASNSIGVVGGVMRAARIVLTTRNMTVLGALADAGGIQPGLKNPQLRLHRGGKIYGVSAKRLYENPDLDTTLRAGDQLIVQEDDRQFISLGAAGFETVTTFPKNELSALEAISIIGGVSDTRGDPGGILVLRNYPKSAVKPGQIAPQHERVVFTFDLTAADGLFSAGQFKIQPDDLVYVSESPLTAVGSILGAIGQAFGVAKSASSL